METINSPTRTVNLARTARIAGGNDFDVRLRQRSERARYRYELANLTPNEACVAAAGEFMSRISGLAITPSLTRGMLALYPEDRMRLAASQDVVDVEAQESLAFILAHFFLKSRWPCQAERHVLAEFMELLQEQGIDFGLARGHPEETLPFLTRDAREL